MTELVKIIVSLQWPTTEYKTFGNIFEGEQEIEILVFRNVENKKRVEWRSKK